MLFIHKIIDSSLRMDNRLHTPPLDPLGNRKAPKYSRSDQMRRIAWGVGSLLIRLSPRPAFAWRRAILRLFGAKIGKQVHVYPTTRLYMPWNVELGDWTALGEDVLLYSLGKIRIGHNVAVSYRSHLCAGSHQLSDPLMPLLKPPIRIEDGAWIGTDAFIGPGVTIGCGAVLGARAVVVRDVDAYSVVAGNPAKVIGQRLIAPAQVSST